jgi:hypothetical protein
MKEQTRHGLASILLALAFPLLTMAQSATGQKVVSSDTRAVLGQRGGQLREDVTGTFKQLRKSRALRYAVEGGNDVTPVVLRYIPLGTRMPDAIAILNGAGYALEVAPDGQLYARSSLGGDFPNFKPSGLEIVLAATDETMSATVAQLHAEIFVRPHHVDQK